MRAGGHRVDLPRGIYAYRGQNAARRFRGPHRSLLPAFKGARAIEQALEYGVKVFGATIHYVDESLDGGHIIAQRAVDYHGDDIAEITAAIHAVEHALYIETIKKLLT
jgi:phosphoribosylglycinamide formyltransferase-1